MEKEWVLSFYHYQAHVDMKMSFVTHVVMSKMVLMRLVLGFYRHEFHVDDILFVFGVCILTVVVTVPMSMRLVRKLYQHQFDTMRPLAVHFYQHQFDTY